MAWFIAYAAISVFGLVVMARARRHAEEDPEEKMRRLNNAFSRMMLPGTKDAARIVELAGQPEIFGSPKNGTVGANDHLCCGCTRHLFVRFRPTEKLRQAAWRCDCGQVNVFGPED